ncbi:MAG: diguanylate phosphodiesterase [Moraxellaceae bacterium]|jgi:EAL domain-containing protein (putative c-di-GMP-specific phosphodiesterase class I)|nr:diguanylate phosphodiesterase [Moraxellaceae bacterium]
MNLQDQEEYALLGSPLVQHSKVARSVQVILRALREHFGMDVAMITEFLDGRRRLFHYVDTPHADLPVHAGDVATDRDGYCHLVVDGRLSEIIPDTAALPVALRLAQHQPFPVGAHLSVPIRLRDGLLYGTLCCVGFAPNPALGPRDLALMHALAQLVAHLLDDELELLANAREAIARIRRVIDEDLFEMVYQPIFRVNGEEGVCGVEALARFNATPRRPPDQWFREAEEVGLGAELEIAAIRKALQELAQVEGDFFVALNCSPGTVFDPRLAAVLAALPAARLVIEITEHAPITDYPPVRERLGRLREGGIRIAIDDTGAGYASMNHVLSLRPDIIKLDISLTRNIHKDVMRRALAGAVAEFARLTNTVIAAEGVEEFEELMTLQELGIRKMQGYYLSRPLPLADLQHILQKETSGRLSFPA